MVDRCHAIAAACRGFACSHFQEVPRIGTTAERLVSRPSHEPLKLCAVAPVTNIEFRQVSMADGDSWAQSRGGCGGRALEGCIVPAVDRDCDDSRMSRDSERSQFDRGLEVIARE